MLRAALVALLFVEVMGLSIRFDSRELASFAPGFAILSRASHAGPEVLAAAVVAILMLRGRRRDHKGGAAAPLAEADVSSGGPRALWPWFAAHGLAFATFTWATAVLMEGGARSALASTAGFATWAFLGLATLVSWAAIGWPPVGWPGALRRNAGLWCAGGGVGLLAWGCGRLSGELEGPLGRATYGLVRLVLSLGFRDVVCRPEARILGTSSFPVEIAPSCSGYEGIGLITILMGAYLWAFRRDLRLSRAWILLPVGVVAIWLANSLRIAALIAVGTLVSPEIALGGFHSQAGWISFNVVGLGLIAASRWFSWLRKDGDCVPDTDSPVAGNPTVAYLAPMVAVVATAMLTGAFSSGFDLLYPLRVAAALVVLWIFRSSYRDLRLSGSWGAFAIGVAVFVGWIALEPLTQGRTSMAEVPAGLASLSGLAAAAWLAARLVGYVVTVPLVEELAFRGYVIRRVGSPDFTAVAPGRFSTAGLILSSVLFGLMHDRVVAGTLAGLAYAYALRRRGELSDAVIAHATTNALLALLVLTTGDWTLWG